MKSEKKKAHKHKEIPRKSPNFYCPTLKILYVGVFVLENLGEETPPPTYKEFGLSNLYAGDPFNSLCAFLYPSSLYSPFANSYLPN